MYKYILILLGFFTFSVQAFSQTTVQATADSINTYIGSRIIVELSITAESGTKYIFPEIKDTINKLIVINRSLVDTIINENNTKLIQKIYITAFDSGAYCFPSLTFFAQHKGGMHIPLYSNMLDLHFKNVDISTMKDISDIKPIYEVENHWYDNFLYYVIGLICIIVAIILYLIYKKRKKPIVEIDNRIKHFPNINPAEFAYSELNDLKAKQYWAIKEYKTHFTLLTDCLRRYIELKYRIPAMESVSFELLNDYIRRTEKEDAHKLLADLFAIADIVKFAKYSPTDEQSIDCLNLAFEFIKLNESD